MDASPSVRAPLLARVPIRLLFVVIVFIGAFLRFFDLDADPSPFKRYGDVSDEGGMSHNARLYAMGTPCADDFLVPDANAALMSALLRVAFKVFGVGFTSTHLVSALGGTALVIALAAFAGAQWGPVFGLLAAGLAAVAEVAVIYSRLGIPEMLQTLFLTLALLSLVRPIYGGTTLAGAFMGLALATKLTAVYWGPAALVVLWYTGRDESGGDWRALALRLLRFGLGFALIVVPFFALWYWPDGAAYWRMIRATADNDTDNALLSLAIFNVPLNYFFGFPAAVLLSTLAAVAASDRRFIARDRALNALLLWIGCFLLTIAFMTDKSDRRFVPLLAPLVLVGARVLGSDRAWTPSAWSAGAAAATLAVASYSAWKGSLVNAFGGGAPRTIALLILLASGIGLLYFLRDRGATRLGLIAAGVAAAGVVLPTLGWLLFRTHTLRDSSRSLNTQLGDGFVAGPLAHTLALEARFYPIFYTPGGVGISRLNAGFDPGRFDYQLFIPRIASMYGPVGFGRAEVPVRVGEIGVLPNFVGHAWWTIEIYRLHEPEAR